MRLPIRARLTAWYVLIAAVALAGVGAFLVLKLRSDLRSTIDREVGSSISVKVSAVSWRRSTRRNSRGTMAPPGAAMSCSARRGMGGSSFGGSSIRESGLC